MFTVKKNPLMSNIIWDIETDKPLCRFTKEIFYTDDQMIINKLIALGFEVASESDDPECGDKIDTPTDEKQKSAVSKPIRRRKKQGDSYV